MATVKGSPTPIVNTITLDLTEDETWDLRNLLGNSGLRTYPGAQSVYDALHRAGFTFDGSRDRGRI